MLKLLRTVGGQEFDVLRTLCGAMLDFLRSFGGQMSKLLRTLGGAMFDVLRTFCAFFRMGLSTQDFGYEPFPHETTKTIRATI